MAIPDYRLALELATACAPSEPPPIHLNLHRSAAFAPCPGGSVAAASSGCVPQPLVMDTTNVAEISAPPELSAASKYHDSGSRRRVDGAFEDIRAFREAAPQKALRDDRLWWQCFCMALGDKQSDKNQTERGARNRGAQPAIDWDAACAYYESLPPEKRSYRAVATKFGVSPRTVETHGRAEKWKERVRAISLETRARTADSLVEARVAEVEEMRSLIDASLVAYAEALRNGMRMSPADLERLNRLSLALTEEALSPQTLGSGDPGERAVRTAKHTRAVLDALVETGALEALGLARLPAEQIDSSPDEEVDR